MIQGGAKKAPELAAIAIRFRDEAILQDFIGGKSLDIILRLMTGYTPSVFKMRDQSGQIKLQ